MATSQRTRGSALAEEVAVGRDRITFRVPSEETEGEVAVFDVGISPGGGPSVFHRHDPFELYRVRRGELAFYVGGDEGAVRRTVAGPGTLVPIGGGVEHTVRNESNEDAEATVVFCPGEPMERFARAAASLGRRRAPGQDELFALAEAHGIEITRSIEDAVVATGGEATAPTSGAGYLTIARFSGDGGQLLDEYRKHLKVMADVGRDHDLIVHAGAKTDDGFLIVNLWPSEEGSEAAARDPRRLAVIEQAQITPGQVLREHHEVAHFEVFEVGAQAAS